jgi:MFS family permease
MRSIKRQPSKTKSELDLVTWDDNDPEHPHNWPAHRRWISTVLIAMYAFIAPMASTMVAPALDTIAEEFQLSSTTEEFLVMSIFLLAFAIGPFLWGPLSEVFGRVRVIQGANMIFLIFNTACGFARNKEQMMAFRFLSGIGGSAPQAVSRFKLRW